MHDSTMNTVGRLILRFLVVPLGAVVGICVAETVVIISHWEKFLAALTANPGASDETILAFVFVAPGAFLALSVAAFFMLLPAAIGVVIAESLAIRSWIYHAVNGGLSAWVGWSLIGRDYGYYDRPVLIVAAGLAAGFAYWLIAGWSAGFWKPVFAPPVSSAAVTRTSPRTP
ncbi:MAG: hypothetical protein J2P54_27195 [Bradyrhizobiaceae bacterium]|nr:hypothetical protein [Bradyrhizobiaceae bacterium]